MKLYETYSSAELNAAAIPTGKEGDLLMKQRGISSWVFLALNIVLALIVVSPLLYCLSVSFMAESELMNYPLRFLPSHLTIENDHLALKMAPITLFLRNSLIVALCCTAGQLLTGALAGYAFAMHEFPGKKLLCVLMLATMMIPGQSIMRFAQACCWLLTAVFHWMRR